MDVFGVFDVVEGVSVGVRVEVGEELDLFVFFLRRR